MKKVLFISFLLAALFAGSTGAEMAMTLKEVVSRSLRNNPELKSAAYGLEMDRLEERIAVGRRYPKIAVVMEHTLYSDPSLVRPIHKAGEFPPLDDDITRAGLALQLPLYAGGAITDTIEASKIRTGAAEQGFAAMKSDLVWKVAAAYSGVLTYRRLAKAAQMRITVLEEEEIQLQKRVDEGASAPIEISRISTRKLEARQEYVILRQKSEEQRSLLAFLVGEKGRIPEPTGIDSTAFVLPQTIGEISSAAEKNHPEIVKAENLVEAARRQLGVIKAKRLPALSLSGSLTETSGSGETFTEWRTGIEFSLPLFDGGAARHAIDQAILSVRTAEERLRAVSNLVMMKIGQAFGDLEAAKAIAKTATQAEKEATEALTIERVRYRSGVATATDLLTAESASWKAAANMLKASNDLFIARLRLLKAAGRLDESCF